MELDFVSVTVKDMERATEFYSELLEQEPAHESDRLVIYEPGDLMLGLYDPTEDGRSVEEVRWGNNCIPAFRVEDLDTEEERISDFAEIEYRYELEDHSGVLFTDTEGNVLEIYERGSS